jgi:hypothetical protein
MYRQVPTQYTESDTVRVKVNDIKNCNCNANIVNIVKLVKMIVNVCVNCKPCIIQSKNIILLTKLHQVNSSESKSCIVKNSDLKIFQPCFRKRRST